MGGRTRSASRLAAGLSRRKGRDSSVWVEIRISNLENRKCRESLQPDTRSTWDAPVRNLSPSRRDGDSLPAPLSCRHWSLVRPFYGCRIWCGLGAYRQQLPQARPRRQRRQTQRWEHVSSSPPRPRATDTADREASMGFGSWAPVPDPGSAS